MARTRRKSSSSKSGGSTLFGILIGLIFGLVAAVAVALFVTKAPMPFVDKASRDPAQTLLPDVRNAPDPNQGLYGKDAAAGSPSTGPTVTAPTPLPEQGGNVTRSQPAPQPDQDGLGDLITSLSNLEKPATPQAAPASPAPGTEAPAAAANKPATANTQTTYYLQAGAFRSEQDAESIKARILLMGLPATVQKGQSNGATIHRVRVGPFKGIDDMNRSRARLGEEKIVSTVVRP